MVASGVFCPAERLARMALLPTGLLTRWFPQAADARRQPLQTLAHHPSRLGQLGGRADTQITALMGFRLESVSHTPSLPTSSGCLPTRSSKVRPDVS